MDAEAIRARLYDLRRILALRAAVGRVASSSEPRAEVVVGRAAAGGARIGLLPGSFNPLTLAHVTLAEAGLRRGGLDRVLFTLGTTIVDKDVTSGAALEDRLLVLDLACERDERLGVLLVNRGLYVDQAELARGIFPNARDVVFLVGFDKIVQIFEPRYYADREAALRRLFELATFLVAPRGSEGADRLVELLERPENRPYARAIRPLDLPPSVRDFASSRVRDAAAEGRLPADQLPPEAKIFVEETGAYSRPDPGTPDRYRVRLALRDRLEAAGGAADFRAAFARAVGESI